MKAEKLLHVLVVMGAGLTGTLGIPACGVDDGAAKDAGADGDYPHISPEICPDGTTDCYGRISPAMCPDGTTNCYGRISEYAPDGGDGGPGEGGAPRDGGPSDAGEAG